MMMKCSEELRRELEERKLDALLITRRANQRYLTGFKGADSYLLVLGGEAIFITDSRYTEQVAQECPEATVVPWRTPYPPLGEVFAGLASKRGLRRLGFEKSVVPYSLYEELREALPGAEWVPTEGIVEKFRQVKTPEELGKIRRACGIIDRAIAAILPLVRPGVSEKDLTAELEYRVRKEGGDGMGFDSIVAFGPNGSKPHAIPSDARLRPGWGVLMDVGAQVEGYRSDITRTYSCGRPDPLLAEIHAIVRRAQAAGVEAMRDDVPGAEVDRLVRGIIADAGHGAHFGHGLGHGVGLEIHEEPFMSPTCTATLRAGMAVTCEPGIYLPDRVGVRIEDTVLIGPEGPGVPLTGSPRDLLEL
jgi:Xaa-Pro aminopeptidase